MAELSGKNQSDQMFHLEDEFLRRILPIFFDHSTRKVFSQAFQNARDTNRMSVNYMRLSSVEDTLRNHPKCGVASISAQLCWSLEQEIEAAPEQDNPAHYDVVGHKPQTVRRKFRDSARYLRYPEPA